LDGATSGKVRKKYDGKDKKSSLPVDPSALLDCHHFPCLSTISRISPLANDISVGSSVFAVSTEQEIEKMGVKLG
jgi:hypothetical protein